ncbi:MAG: type III pantothenate kinase [Sulfuriferula sp.]
MLLLAIDAGNTRIKWGLHNGQQWLQRGFTTADEIPLLPSALVTRPDHIITSNVAGGTIATTLAQMFPALPLYTVRAASAQCGVSNRYERAEQLGSDRWAALIAVHMLSTVDKLETATTPPTAAGRCVANPALVVTAGTALTVDALHQGNFLGGIIVPGYRLMRTALASSTAQLNTDSGKFSLLPRNTPDAISSGCLLALSGSIEQMRIALQKQTQLPVAIWLNGGDSPLLAPLFPLSHFVEENLVLTGLYFIAQEVFT